MAWVVCQDQVPEKCVLPRLVGFADAAEIIEDLQRECDDVLVAIDQPIIVPNDVGRRPVDCIADSVMQHLKSSALMANRTEKGKGFNNTYLHGNEAPVWKFMSKIGPCGYSGTTDREDERALVAFQSAQMPTDDNTHGTHVIEVYPAMALTALNPKFMCRGSAARYDPENYQFSSEDWETRLQYRRLLCGTIWSSGDLGMDKGDGRAVGFAQQA